MARAILSCPQSPDAMPRQDQADDGLLKERAMKTNQVRVGRPASQLLALLFPRMVAIVLGCLAAALAISPSRQALCGEKSTAPSILLILADDKY
jgi:hypothetical protein